MALVLALRAQALDPSKAITQYVQTVWTNQTGLPQNSVHSIAQTARGYLWFATEEGVARFDGNRFSIFDDRNTRGLPDSFVTRLLYTYRDGSVWAATRNAISQYRLTGFVHTYSQADGLFPADITALCEGLDGSLWIATGGGLNRLQQGKVTGFTVRDGLPDNQVNSIAVTRDGALWLGTPNGLARYRDGRFSHFTKRDGLPDNEILALAPSRNGSLWVAARTGIVRWAAANPAANTGLRPGNRLATSLLEDRDGNLWIGWARNGITRFTGGAASAYTTVDGLPSNNIDSLFEDKDGNLWIGTLDAGVAELRDARFTNFGKPEGLSSNNIWSVLEARDGSIWTGAGEGGLNHLEGAKVTTYSGKQGLPSDSIFGLAESGDGSLWIGSDQGAVTRLQRGRLQVFRDPQVRGARVVAFDPTPARGVWVAFHQTRGLALLQNGRFSHFDVPGLINAMYPDGHGGLWLGTDHFGVSHFRDGKIQTYRKSDGLLSDFAQSVYVDSEGTVWAGTSPGGLNRIKDGRITRYSVDDGLFNETVGSILEDDAGYLWMTCNKGIFKVQKRELNDFAEHRVRSIHSVVFNAADGMRSPECDFGAGPASWKDSHGRLWFATSAGLARIDPNHLRHNPEPPPVWIESVLFAGKPVAPPVALPKDGIRLGSESGRLEVRFSSPDFTAPAKTEFRYRLFGFDSNWTDPGASRTASYTNLPPGKFRFQVQAASSYGVWNLQGASLQFEIAPKFYQTPYFFLVSALLLIVAAKKLYDLRMEYLLRRTRELEQRVAARTAELEKAMNAAEAAQEALREQATRDGLTGLWNRNAIFEILERELALALPERNPLAVLMLDLDHFKSVNDTFGHVTGDRVLRKAARRIAELMRPEDSAGRYGGEEIMVVLPNCALGAAQSRAEQLRLAIASLRFRAGDGASLSVTCSFGVACASLAGDLDALVSSADAALYAAKAGGRNRVVLATAIAPDGERLAVSRR